MVNRQRRWRRRLESIHRALVRAMRSLKALQRQGCVHRSEGGARASLKALGGDPPKRTKSPLNHPLALLVSTSRSTVSSNGAPDVWSVPILNTASLNPFTACCRDVEVSVSKWTPAP